MYLDIKNTVWERVHFDSIEQMNEVIDLLKRGKLHSGNDVCEHLDKSTEWIDETSEELSVEDNNGLSTMDIIVEGKTVWENGTELGE